MIESFAPVPNSGAGVSVGLAGLYESRNETGSCSLMERIAE
jgi:hypothetical protein